MVSCHAILPSSVPSPFPPFLVSRPLSLVSCLLSPFPFSCLPSLVPVSCLPSLVPISCLPSSALIYCLPSRVPRLLSPIPMSLIYCLPYPVPLSTIPSQSRCQLSSLVAFLLWRAAINRVTAWSTFRPGRFYEASRFITIHDYIVVCINQSDT